MFAISFEASGISYKEAVKDAAYTYGLEPCLIQSVLRAEGGKEGELTYHSNGSVDIGRAQINQGGEWERVFNEVGISSTQIKDDSNISALLAAFIIFVEYSRSGDLIQGISAFHKGYSNRHTLSGYQYTNRVLSNYEYLMRNNLCF